MRPMEYMIPQGSLYNLRWHLEKSVCIYTMSPDIYPQHNQCTVIDQLLDLLLGSEILIVLRSHDG